jgi:hypothetical protein
MSPLTPLLEGVRSLQHVPKITQGNARAGWASYSFNTEGMLRPKTELRTTINSSTSVKAIHRNLPAAYNCMHVCAFCVIVCACVYMYVCMSVQRVDLCACVCPRACICVCAHINIILCMYVCACVCACVCAEGADVSGERPCTDSLQIRSDYIHFHIPIYAHIAALRSNNCTSV